MDSRVTVFTGPVFAEDDPIYADKTGADALQVPLAFWKVLVWKQDGALKSLALLANQTRTLKQAAARAEGLADPDQLNLMANFLTTVARIETLTGFDFGAAVKQADIRRGGRDAERADAEAVGAEQLKRAAAPRKTTSKKRRA